MMKTKIFISYCYDDVTITLADLFKVIGSKFDDIEVFAGHDNMRFEPTSDFKRTIKENIRSSDVFLLVLHEENLKSIENREVVHFEINTAYHLNKPVNLVYVGNDGTLLMQSLEGLYDKDKEKYKYVPKLHKVNWIYVNKNDQRNNIESILGRIQDEYGNKSIHNNKISFEGNILDEIEELGRLEYSYFELYSSLSDLSHGLRINSFSEGFFDFDKAKSIYDDSEGLILLKVKEIQHLLKKAEKKWGFTTKYYVQLGKLLECFITIKTQILSKYLKEIDYEEYENIIYEILEEFELYPKIMNTSYPTIYEMITKLNEEIKNFQEGSHTIKEFEEISSNCISLNYELFSLEQEIKRIRNSINDINELDYKKKLLSFKKLDIHKKLELVLGGLTEIIEDQHKQVQISKQEVLSLIEM